MKSDWFGYLNDDLVFFTMLLLVGFTITKDDAWETNIDDAINAIAWRLFDNSMIVFFLDVDSLSFASC